MHDPFFAPKTIRLDFNSLLEVFYAYIVQHPVVVADDAEGASMVLRLGDARTAASVLKANGVRHFDYGPNLLYHEDIFATWLAGAKEAEFEV